MTTAHIAGRVALMKSAQSSLTPAHIEWAIKAVSAAERPSAAP
ncbi:hypothetical protein [Streptomyces sp. NPDC003393]